ncbi:hypothetical protein NEUTE2DRAFT_143130 [Neurospora tetrasperma FGSC 2509]|nr:hypothetical protein NEUTE2DRAFT_143130 [Neurospora tetrasperma FGSC 2509]
MIVRTFTWLALAQPDVCVRLNLFNQCWNLNIGQKVFFGSLSVLKSTHAANSKPGVDF